MLVCNRIRKKLLRKSWRLILTSLLIAQAQEILISNIAMGLLWLNIADVCRPPIFKKIYKNSAPSRKLRIAPSNRDTSQEERQLRREVPSRYRLAKCTLCSCYAATSHSSWNHEAPRSSWLLVKICLLLSISAFWVDYFTTSSRRSKTHQPAAAEDSNTQGNLYKHQYILRNSSLTFRKDKTISGRLETLLKRPAQTSPCRSHHMCQIPPPASSTQTNTVCCL